MTETAEQHAIGRCRRCLRPGTVVRSRQGHDEGRLYLVLATEDDTLWLADGRYRTIDHPKRKNAKHVVALTMSQDDVAFTETVESLSCDRERDIYIRKLIDSVTVELR